MKTASNKYIITIILSYYLEFTLYLYPQVLYCFCGEHIECTDVLFHVVSVLFSDFTDILLNLHRDKSIFSELEHLS